MFYIPLEVFGIAGLILANEGYDSETKASVLRLTKGLNYGAETPFSVLGSAMEYGIVANQYTQQAHTGS